MKIITILVITILLSSCTMVNMDINRSYCPKYRNSLGADIHIVFEDGSNINLPISCIRID